MSESDSPRFAVRPRTLLLVMLAVGLIAGAAIWYSLSQIPEGRVKLRAFSEDSTATASFAGMFPAEQDPPLANPLGVAWDGRTLYVAESDAGRISLFDSRGGALGAIGLVPAEGASVSYPASIALVGEDRIAVVDNAARRVIVVSVQPAEAAEILLEVGSGTEAAGQPTSVWYTGGEYFVFDASISAVRVYDDRGVLDRTIGEDLQPAVAFSTSLYLQDGLLYLVDSNGGRVLVIDPVTGRQQMVFGDRYALPRAVAAVGAGFAVVDAFDRAVFFTAASGERLDVIDADTVPDAPLSSPRGAVWIDDDQRLYVADAGSGRMMVFNVRLDPALQ